MLDKPKTVHKTSNEKNFEYFFFLQITNNYGACKKNYILDPGPPSCYRILCNFCFYMYKYICFETKERPEKDDFERIFSGSQGKKSIFIYFDFENFVCVLVQQGDDPLPLSGCICQECIFCLICLSFFGLIL